MPQNYVRPPSPPPTYEEVAKTVALPPPPALSQGSNPRDPPNLGSGDGSGQQPRSDDFDQPGKNTGGVYSALKGFDHDYDSESPPEYSAAVAALKVMQEEEAKEQSGGGEVKDGQGQDPTLGDHVSAPTLTLKLQEVTLDFFLIKMQLHPNQKQKIRVFAEKSGSWHHTKERALLKSVNRSLLGFLKASNWNPNSE